MIEYYYYQQKIYCKTCIKFQNNFNKKCLKCPIKIIFDGLTVFSEIQTLHEILFNKKSIARFGDGEFNLIFGKDIGFQKYSKTISKRLLQVLNSNESNLLIGINILPNIKDVHRFTKKSKQYYIQWIEKYKLKIGKILNKTKNYYSSFITRFYIEYKSKKGINKYVLLLKKIWDKKDILIIEGEHTKIGVGNNLINNANSIKRIICPYLNSFKVYNKIIKEIKNINNNRILLFIIKKDY